MIWKRDEIEERDEEPEGRRMADQQSQSNEVTVVGQGAKLEGMIVSAGSLRIDGQVKGEINAEGDVLLSGQAVVEADIKATNVSVAGKLKGDIAAGGTAELARGGRIDGDITSKTLIIQEGGIFCGQSNMDQPKPAGSVPAPVSRPATPPEDSDGATRAERSRVS
ncbi:MAG: polymer-forming cytoskeletal protein [Actinomycetota bacterium]